MSPPSGGCGQAPSRLNSFLATQPSGLSLGEAKAIIQRELGKYANDDEDIAQIYNIAGGLMRQTGTLIKNLLELIALNRDALETGRVTLKELIAKAGSKLL